MWRKVSEKEMLITKINTEAFLKGDSEYQGVTDPLQMIQIVREHPEVGFLYVTRAVPKSSVHYHPYSLKVVKYQDIDNLNYFTISPYGVVQVTDGVAEFTPLYDWEREYKLYFKLIKIPTFANFRLWKAFNVWKKNVLNKKKLSCIEKLEDSLFILNPVLQMMLFMIQKICLQLRKGRLFRVEKGKTCTLEEFTQMTNQECLEVSEKLVDFRIFLKQKVFKSFLLLMESKGFCFDLPSSGKPLVSAEVPTLKTEKKLMEQFSVSNVSGNIVNIHEYSNEKSQQRIQEEDQLPSFSGHQMDIENETSYIAQAQKRLLCTRLTKFLHLVDYKLANLFHQMVVNTASDFLNKLKENLTGHAIELHDDEEEHNVVDIETEMDLSSDKNKPLFLIKLVLEEKDFAFCPSCKEFLTNVKEAVERSKKAVMTFENLASDDYFESFTSPVINGKQEENEVAQGPVLTEMFQEDENLHRLLLDIEQTLQTAFVMATKQAENYRPLHTFYLENEKLNLEELVEHEEDVQFYSAMLSKFHEQHKMIEAVPKLESVGLILMDNSGLHAKILPSPLKCIKILNNRLPKLAKTKVDFLSNEANIAQSKLVSTPNSTTELVERLTFLDKTERRIEDMKAGLNVTKELYDLMDSYSVPVPPEDIAGYSALGGLLCHLQKTIKNELSERETYKTNLDTSLVKDIDELKHEVKDLKRDVEESFLMDVNSEPQKVTDLLSSLAVRLEQITERASQYKQYQRDFQFEVTHFEELEKVASELRLKQLLWNSFFTWNALMQEWRECDFEKINPEHLRTQTTEYLETIHQIERGLPVNSVTLSLKEKVEEMKEKVSVITYLRSPAMKSHHWDLIEGVLQQKITTDGPLTLKKLEKFNVFTFHEAIQKISNQASSEDKLEVVLKKADMV